MAIGFIILYETYFDNYRLGRIILEPKPRISWAEFFQTEACLDFELERDIAE
jgi:hypothetical protein